MTPGSFPLLSMLVVAAFGASVPAFTQDPYTRGDPAAMEKAGYVSFGPFEWRAGHTTDDVRRALGGSPLFVETAHFRIGCALPAYRPPDRKARKKLTAELGQLRRQVGGNRGE